jgi:lysozyme
MAEIKTLDQAGLDFLANEEGLRLSPYLDSKGIPTIGIGMTYYPGTGKRVTLKDPKLTNEQAQEMFKQIVIPYETMVWSVTRDDINQNQFNALCSLCYNIGVNGFKGSTVVKRLNKNPHDPTIAKAFEMWKKPIVLLGRRKREAKLYFS